MMTGLQVVFTYGSTVISPVPDMVVARKVGDVQQIQACPPKLLALHACLGVCVGAPTCTCVFERSLSPPCTGGPCDGWGAARAVRGRHSGRGDQLRSAVAARAV